MSPDPFREPFDPRCTEWVAFADLELGDHIDYWGDARPVVMIRKHGHGEGNVTLITQGMYGQDLALAPGTTELTYRMTRKTRNETIVRSLYRATVVSVRNYAPADADAMAQCEDEMVPQITAAIEGHPDGDGMLRDLALGRISPETVRARLVNADAPDPSPSWLPGFKHKETPR